MYTLRIDILSHRNKNLSGRNYMIRNRKMPEVTSFCQLPARKKGI